MDSCEFCQAIDEVYAIIEKRRERVELENLSKGYKIYEASFEDIDLEDILESKLVPLFIEVFNRYPRPLSHKAQMNRIFVATLCEIAKRGFPTGGLPKTIDKYLGYSFSRNRYYKALMPVILQEEKIEVTLKTGRKYENAIVCQSGIPKNMHSEVMKLFLFYWKWFRNIERDKRHKELEQFVQTGKFDDEYILDNKDYNYLIKMRKETSFENISTKATKMCLKLEEVFLEIEKKDFVVSHDNIGDVCGELSSSLGYNILTIINEKKLKKELVDYSQKISFLKFEKILNNLGSEEFITLPTGKKALKKQYSKRDYICGIHNVRGVDYEVSYKIEFGLEELVRLSCREIHKLNDRYLYLSNTSFDVKIDGWEQPIRELVFKNTHLYIFVGKIPAGSIAYIDEKPINALENTGLRCAIRKRWDYELKRNYLGVYIDKLSFYDPQAAMHTLRVKLDEQEKTKGINSSGYVQISDTWLKLSGTEIIATIRVAVGNTIVIEKELICKDIMVYGKYTGISIEKAIDLSDWIGDSSIVVFSKEEITKQQKISLSRKDNFGNYLVYEGKFNFDEDFFAINDNRYIIKHSSKPYLSLQCEQEFHGDKLVIGLFEDVNFKLNNCEETSGLLIKVFHKGKSVSKNVEQYLDKEIRLRDVLLKPNNYSGMWEILLIDGQSVVQRIEFAILPNIKITNLNGIVKLGSRCKYSILSDTNCFSIEGEDVNEQIIDFKLTNDNYREITPELNIKKTIYINDCDLYLELDFPILIWDLQIREKGNNTIKTNILSIDYYEINKYEILAYTTDLCDLKIKANDIIERRYFNKGTTVIKLADYFREYKSVNNFLIEDDKGGNHTINVTYRPKLTLLDGYEIRSGMLHFHLKYAGPIDVKIGVSIYENNLRIERKEIVSSGNRLQLEVAVPHINKKRYLTVEASFDGRSRKEIGEINIEEVIAKENQEMILSDYKNINSIINSRGLKAKLTSNLFEVLRIEGSKK